MLQKSPVLLEYAAIMLGGALGSGARVWVSTAFAARFGESFPWGTFTVNALGCLLIGAVIGLTGPESPFVVSPWVRQAVALGVLGGFTTFSSFSIQTLALFSEGHWPQAAAYVLLSLFVCLAATAVGLTSASAVASKF